VAEVEEYQPFLPSGRRFLRDVLVQATGTLLAASVAWLWAISVGYVSRPEGQRLLVAVLGAFPPLIMVVAGFLLTGKPAKLSTQQMSWLRLIFALSALVILVVYAIVVLDWF